MRPSLDLNDAEARAKAQAEINGLQQELTNVVPESEKDYVKNVILYRLDNFSFLVMRFDYRFSIFRYFVKKLIKDIFWRLLVIVIHYRSYMGFYFSVRMHDLI